MVGGSHNWTLFDFVGDHCLSHHIISLSTRNPHKNKVYWFPGRRLAMLVCLNSMTQSVVKNASCDGLSELEMSRQSATCWRGECEPE